MKKRKHAMAESFDSMEKHYYSIAGFNLGIYFHRTDWFVIADKLKKEISEYLQGFRLKNKPDKIDYHFDFIWEDFIDIIINPKNKNQHINFCKSGNLKSRYCFYRISCFEFQIILQNVLMKLLIARNGFMLHGSAVKTGKRAYIFLAKSGGGKSTVRNFLKSKYPTLADDYVIIRKEKKKYFFYQTPFIERKCKFERSSGKIELAKVFFLRKSSNFKIIKLNGQEQIVKLLARQFRTSKFFLNQHMKNILKFCAEFNYFYRLDFVKNKEKLLQILF